MEEIRSPSNPRIKRLKKLLSDPGARREEGVWAVEGVRSAEEAIASGLKVLECYAETERGNPRLDALVEKAGMAGAAVFGVSRGVLREFSDTSTPQGICLLVSPPSWSAADLSGEGPLLILDRLRDPGNLGTLFRTAAAAGVRGVVLVGGTVDPSNPKVLRASAGAAFRLPFLRVTDHTGVKTLTQGPLYSTKVSSGINPEVIDLSGDFALILGQEAEGVATAWEGLVEGYITIPMESAVESINVAAAGAVLLFEAARQRRASSLRLS